MTAPASPPTTKPAAPTGTRRALRWIIGYVTSAVIGIGGGLVGLHYLRADPDPTRDLAAYRVPEMPVLGPEVLQGTQTSRYRIADLWYVRSDGKRIYGAQSGQSQVMLIADGDLPIGSQRTGIALGTVLLTTAKPIRFYDTAMAPGAVPAGFQATAVVRDIPPETLESLRANQDAARQQAQQRQRETATTTAEERRRRAEAMRQEVIAAEAQRHRDAADARGRPAAELPPPPAAAPAPAPEPAQVTSEPQAPELSATPPSTSPVTGPRPRPVIAGAVWAQDELTALRQRLIEAESAMKATPPGTPEFQRLKEGYAKDLAARPDLEKRAKHEIDAEAAYWAARDDATAMERLAKDYFYKDTPWAILAREHIAAMAAAHAERQREEAKRLEAIPPAAARSTMATPPEVAALVRRYVDADVASKEIEVRQRNTILELHREILRTILADPPDQILVDANDVARGHAAQRMQMHYRRYVASKSNGKGIPNTAELIAAAPYWAFLRENDRIMALTTIVRANPGVTQRRDPNEIDGIAAYTDAAVLRVISRDPDLAAHRASTEELPRLHAIQTEARTTLLNLLRDLLLRDTLDPIVAEVVAGSRTQNAIAAANQAMASLRVARQGMGAGSPISGADIARMRALIVQQVSDDALFVILRHRGLEEASDAMITTRIVSPTSDRSPLQRESTVCHLIAAIFGGRSCVPLRTPPGPLPASAPSSSSSWSHWHHCCQPPRPRHRRLRSSAPPSRPVCGAPGAPSP